MGDAMTIERTEAGTKQTLIELLQMDIKRLEREERKASEAVLIAKNHHQSIAGMLQEQRDRLTELTP